MNNDFDLNTISGLTRKEAEKTLEAEGFNEIPRAMKRSFISIALSVVREPMILLLVGGGLIYLLLGEVRDALLLLSFVFVITGITLYQERKTERTLEALRDLSSPRALVIRDGVQRRIAGREVVRDDIAILSEGDRVPADGALLYSNNLMVDESILTGESVPVSKRGSFSVSVMERPGGDNSPFVYSGTLIVRGLGVARVLATGMNTEFGRIGRSLRSIENEPTLLQKETSRIVRNLAVFGISLCTVSAVVYGLTRGNWLNGLLTSITLAMAILPEEFPVVLTIFLALGAWRISQSNVLTRRMPAIETLGATTVLCSDKTGTLTLNRMKVTRLFAGGNTLNFDHDTMTLPEDFHRLVEFSILASQKDPFDPMEKALKELGEEYLNHTEHLHRDWVLMREYPLSEKIFALSRVWQSPDGADYIIAAKGAPEAIFDLCHLSEQEIQSLSKEVASMSDEGLRVLGVARARFRQTELPSGQHDFRFEFLGLIGFSDPVRPSVPPAIKECYEAGIRVIMITGDYPGTAQNIARQVGLKSEGIVTGAELSEMPENVIMERAKSANIFARVVPEQKLHLVNALKAGGEVVAMTGDGVNDAPALKAANIGIAMGGRGTDVAREASALVLLDDDFSSIVKAIRLGRRIFDNLRKAMAYILAIHVPIAGLSLVPVLFNLPLILLPVHVVFLELVIDPACSTVFEAEPEEQDIMKRPPRRPDEPLFNLRTVMLSLIQGLIVLAVVLAIYGFNLYRDKGELEARAMAFTTLIVANLGLILTNLSRTRTIMGNLTAKNTALWLVLISAMVFLGFVIYVPFLRDVFRFSQLHPNDLLLCLIFGITSILWFEVLKLFSRR